MIKNILRSILILSLATAIIPGTLRAGEAEAVDNNSKTNVAVMLGPSLPAGSPEFNQDSFFGISVRAIGHRQLGNHRPQLSIELETGVDLMGGWYDGAIMSIPLFINARRDLFHSRNGHLSAGLFGGLGAHYHQVIFGIGGVEAEPQLRPSIQAGFGINRSISKKWAINLRSTYTRSFTSNQVAEFAGMTIRSRDRYGYGSLLVMIGLSRIL
jgi:hypothetical protein